MEIRTYECNECGAKTPDRKAVIIVTQYKVNAKGKTYKVTEHFCTDNCLKKHRGYEEIKVAK
jgi:YHS domain-containing protein